MNAIKELTPNDKHKNCAQHIWANWKKKRFKGEKFKSLFWDATKCPNHEQLKGKLEEIRKESNDTYEVFMNRGPNFFLKAYIESWCKFDMINNNICETFNSYNRNARENPVLKMLDSLRENLMERMEKQVRSMKRVKDKICLRIRKKLKSIRKNTRHYIAKPIVREKFQVSMFNEQFMVDLVAGSCSCRWWTLTSNNTFNSSFIMFET